MTLKRIDLFNPPVGQYGVLQRITEDICAAMNRAGIQARLLTAERNNPKPFLDAIFKDKPDCTFSLNGLLPDPQGHFFCDMIKIPHVACLVDSPNQYTTLAGNRRTIITCPDRYAVKFFKGLHAQRVLFFPHGASSAIAPDPALPKKYEVLCLASCIDYEAIRSSWQEKYPKKLIDALDDAAEASLSDSNIPYVEAFVSAVNKHLSKSAPFQSEKFHLMQLLDDLEMYIRGKERIEFLRSIQDARVDVFGSGSTEWKKYISKKQSNIQIHPPVPFNEALKLMQQAKILLNSCPWITSGGHERLFAGIASGALVITAENSYLREHFEDGRNLVFYRYGKWAEANDRINRYLEDDEARERIVASGNVEVRAHHTWDARIASLIQELPLLLDQK